MDPLSEIFAAIVDVVTGSKVETSENRLVRRIKLAAGFILGLLLIFIIVAAIYNNFIK